MRRRVVDPSQGGGTGIGFSMPAPTGGWNARDAISAMPPTDAVFLDNWFPALGGVQLRPGSALSATLPSGKSISTLLHAAKLDGTTKLFAAANDGIYDWTAGGTIGAAVYAATNGYVQYQPIVVGGITYLWCCNGVDDCFYYKSDTNDWHVLNAGSAPIALTGITSNKVTNVSLWQNRIILCEKDSMKWWYLPLNSVGGAAAAYDMGSLFKRGGYVLATAGWSIDAGNGPQNRLIVISSQGEIAVFNGTDPSDATTFSLIGLYFVGRPLGKRCYMEVPEDLCILSESGIWPLTKVMATATLDRRNAVSDKIVNAYMAYAQNYGSSVGWQPLLFHPRQAMLVNVPLPNGVSYQLVMNINTKAWCRFTNWSATCMMSAAGNLYYATGNKVFQAWTGTRDRNGYITGRAKQAFVRVRQGRNAHIKLVRPILTSDQSLTLSLALDADFSDLLDYTSVIQYGQAISKWDSAIWGTSVWSSSSTLKSWRSVSNVPARAFAMRMQIAALDTTVSWQATDYIADIGGIFG